MIKRAALDAAAQLGISTLIGRSRWRRKRLLVLCYHGVSLRDEHEWNPALYVSPETLAERLMLLQRLDCQVLRLGEAIERLYSNTLPDRAVVLTFDDGYYDFMARAFPLLSKFGHSATVYLTTKRVEHNRPIVGLTMSYVLWKARDRTLDGRDLPGLGTSGLPLRTVVERMRICERVGTALHHQRVSPALKDDIVRQIAVRVGVDYDALAAERLLTLMNPEEVALMAGRGVDFQLHTHLHRTPENPDLFASDIRVNHERIEAMTGTRPTHFCYPSGDYRASYLPVLRAAGVVSATTCERGLASPQSEPLLIPRFVDTNDITAGEFVGWVTGSASWVPQRVRPGARIARERLPVGSSGAAARL